MRLRRIRPVTAVLLIVVASLLLWANLQTGEEWHMFGAGADKGKGAPAELDPVTRYFFSRGWPLPPWKVCMYHGNRFRPEDGSAPFAMALNFIVACLILGMTVALSEWLVNRLARKRDRL